MPYRLGFADETGTGRGLGHTINVPMPFRADDDLYVSALSSTMERIRSFAPSLLIVSLGLDTFITDPISDLAVTTDYRTVISEVLVKRHNETKIANVFPNVPYAPLGLFA